MPHISIGESCSKGFKPVSYLTKKVEGVGHSHIFISWKDQYGLRWVAEARGGGIRVVSNVEFKEDNLVIGLYKYGCTEEQLERAVRYIWEQSHKSYAFLQIAGLFWMRAARFLFGSRNFTNPFRDGEHSQICCEFGLNTATTALGIPLPNNVENYGLVETRAFNEKHGEKAPQEKIDRINRK